MTAEQLDNFLQECGISEWSIRIRDARYVLPATQWIFGAFAEGFAKVRPQFDLGEWRPEEGDCDDFEDLACVYARFLHRLELAIERARAKDAGEAPPIDGAIAFGSFEYLIGEDPEKAHAINCAVVIAPGGAQGGIPKLVFFEPQTGLEVDLTAGEVCSCQEIRF